MGAAHVRFRWIVTALLILFPVGAMTASPSRVQGSASTDISVTLVEIPVEVTRGDAPVTGLTAADFEVVEGRRSLPIVSFEPIDLETPPAPGAPPPPPAARRHLLLLFDFAFSQPHLLAQGISSAREMIAKGLDPRDMVAVGTYLPKGEIQLLLSFTTDRAAAARTLSALEQLTTGKLPEGKARESDPLRLTGMDARTLLTQAWRVDERNFSQEMLLSLGTTDGTLKGGFLQANVLSHSSAVHKSNHEAAMRGHITAMAAALDGLADVLRPVAGRKYLALFSNGFPMNVLSAESETVQRANTDGAQTLGQLERTLQEMRRSGWILHSVDLKGTRGGGLSADGLFFLANQTGGSLVEGTNDLAKGLGQAMRRSAHGYLISVQSDDLPLDGAYHKIDVRLRNAPRGTAIHHRGGYYAPLPFARQDDVRRLAEAARLVAGDDQQDDLGIQVVAVPLKPGPDSTPVAVLVEVPGDRLLAPGSPRVGLEVYGYALGDGGTSDFFAQSVDMDPAKVGGRLAQGGVRVLGRLDLPPGEHRLRVLVRDRHDGRSSILTIPLATSSESRIDALFLPPAEDPWLVVSPADPAFDLHGRSVLPAAQASLSAAGEAQLLIVGHGLAGAPGEGAVLRSRILDSAGKPATGGEIELLAVTAGEAGEPDMVIGRLNAGSLPPGAYLLELRLGRQIRATAVTARPFSISARK